jgi:hypothetical protein
MTRQITLAVNEMPIPLDYFVESFIDHTISGMLSSLKGTGQIQSVDLSIKGEDVNLVLNNAPVPINPFVSEIIRNTVVGMTSSLKGVSEINKLEISIRR